MTYVPTLRSITLPKTRSTRSSNPADSSRSHGIGETIRREKKGYKHVSNLMNALSPLPGGALNIPLGSPSLFLGHRNTIAWSPNFHYHRNIIACDRSAPSPGVTIHLRLASVIYLVHRLAAQHLLCAQPTYEGIK